MERRSFQLPASRMPCLPETMTEYSLYLESGPRRRKTMVHVLDLLGCTAQGPTTEEALEAAPAAIRDYLRFLQRHGEAVDPEAPFTTAIAGHVMEGAWLGNGDPTPGFGPDFAPLDVADLRIHLRRLGWLQEGLLELIRDLPPEQWLAEPAAGGRSIARIVEHVAESHCVYLRYIVGRVDGLPEALRAVQTALHDVRFIPDPGPFHEANDLPTALIRLWQISGSRLEAMTVTERTQPVPHGQVTWTARRGVRRMLEHAREHLLEIERRRLHFAD
jgi:predicted RNase H-like HicB family nuclease